MKGKIEGKGKVKQKGKRKTETLWQKYAKNIIFEKIFLSLFFF